MKEEKICYNCQHCFENPMGGFYCQMWLKSTGGHKTCRRFKDYPPVSVVAR